MLIPAVKRLPTAVLAVIAAAAVGWWLLPVLVLIAVVAVAVERVVHHFETAQLRATVDSYEQAGAALPERMRALASWGDLRPRGEVPAPPQLRPDQHWEPIDTATSRQWTVVIDRPRLRARVAAGLRPYWTDVRQFLARHEPRFWVECDLPERALTGAAAGRHRAPEAEPVRAAAALADGITATKSALDMPPGEFERALDRLHAEVYAGVVRGARR